MESNNKKMIKNSTMMFIMNLAKMVFPFITLPYLTRVLSTNAYGTVAYVKTMMSYMQIIVDFGFALSATRDIVQEKSNRIKLGFVVGNTLLGKMLLGGIAFIVLIIVSLCLPILKNNLLFTLLSYLVVFESIFLMDFLFRGLEIMHIITIRFILMKTISTVLTFCMVRNDKDILLIPILDIIGSFAAIVLVFLEVKKLHIKPRCSGLRKTWRTIKHSFVYFLSNVASTSFNLVSTLIIGVQLSETEVAYWSVCMQVATTIQSCYIPIADGIYPQMIKTKSVGLIKRVIKIFFPVVCISSVLAYFWAEVGMYLLGGEEYVIAAPIFRLLIPILVFGFLGVIMGWPALDAIGKAKEVTISTVLAMLVQLLLLIMLLLCHKFTLEYLAVVRSITELVFFNIRFYFVRKYKYLFAD